MELLIVVAIPFIFVGGWCLGFAAAAKRAAAEHRESARQFAELSDECKALQARVDEIVSEL